MKFLKKALPILVSAVLLGSTIGFAAADLGSYPAPFVANGAADVAIVYGVDAAVTDMEAAGIFSSDLATELASQTAGTSETVTTGGVTEDEVVLGGNVNVADLATDLDDSDISSLIDDSISWDDGTGSEDYDVHEEIALNDGGKLKIMTSLDDEDYSAPAMEVGADDIIYKYIFDEAINLSAVGTDSADDFILTILGQEMEITDISAAIDSITVNLAVEKTMKTDETYTVDSKVVTVKGIFSSSVSVDVGGETKVVSEDTTRTINGVKIEVTDIGYSSDNPELSIAVLKIGEDIEKTYEDGDAFIGEDEDDPTWDWYITNTSEAKPIIGVTYSDDSDAEKTGPDENPAGVGESYVLPYNFAEVKFVGLTSVTNKEYKVYFDDSIDLYGAWGDNPAKQVDDGKVLIIEGPDSESIDVLGTDSSKVAIWLNSTKKDAITNDTTARVYAFDDDDDNQFEYINLVSNNTGGEIASLENDDTSLDVDLGAFMNTTTVVNLTIDDGSSINEDIVINVTGTSAFEKLGPTVEDADNGDVKVGSSYFGTEENTIMQHYGIVVEEPESNADNDEVVISVPSEQVYATVAVLAKGGSVSGGVSAVAALGDVLMTDAEAIAAPNTNMVVIGGSAINKVAAAMLGLTYPAYGADFTAATEAGEDEAIVMIAANPYDSTKQAMLVAGWAAKDTTAAAKYVINNAANLADKTEQVLTTATGVAVIKA